MKGLENDTYRLLLIVSNIIALALLFISWKWPRVSALFFSFLFAWASWMNWSTVLQTPERYLEYASFTWSDLYKEFINGWFSLHIRLVVGFVATCQGLIALSMFFNGWIFRIGAIGAIIFLLAIIPLGVGSGFPCTLILSIAMWMIYRSGVKDNLAK